MIYTRRMTYSQASAVNAGFDLTLIEENLRLTPEKRLQQHQRSLDMLEQLQSAYSASLNHQGNEQPKRSLTETE